MGRRARIWRNWLPTPSRVRKYVRKRREERALARAKQAWRAERPPPETRTVVFVAGCQRSGTTMLGRILGQSMEIDHFPETDRRAFRPILIRGAEVLNRLISESTARCVLFKPISDSQRIADLLGEHPGSKALWVYRQYSDVANSAVVLWGDHFLQVMQGIAEGTGDWGWREERISEDCRGVIQSLVKPGLNVWDASALFWYMRNRIFFDQELDKRRDILPVKYEALVQRPAEEFERIYRFMGVEFQPETVATVHPRSVGKSEVRVADPVVIRACDEMVSRLDVAAEYRKAGRSE